MNLPVKLKHIMVITGEPSGDFHAAGLVRSIKKQNPNIYFSGIGGLQLQKQQVDLFFDITHLSAMGLTEVLMQFRQIKNAYHTVKQKLRIQKPDLLILIDYPGFNLKVAQFAKEHHDIKILYYITPKVWAWKKSRLKKIKQYVDHAALILPFEEKIFKLAGIPSTYVGNPLVDEYPEHTAKPFILPKMTSNKDTVVIGLLPGSRKAEVDKLMGIMIRTGDLLLQKQKNIKFLISKSDSIKKAHIERFINLSPKKEVFEISAGPVKAILSKSDLIIAASGTVTLEAALYCVPTILIYRMSPMTYKIARFFVKLEYVGLANLIVNQEVMPEFLQDDATPEKISSQALNMIDNLSYFQKQLLMVRKFLGRKGASLRAASIAIDLLRNSSLPQ